MSIANILVRPRILERFAADSLRIGDVVPELMARLAADVAQNGTATQKISGAALKALGELNQEMESRIQQATPKIRDWFQPLTDNVLSGFAIATDPKDPESALHSFADFLDWLAAAIEKLDSNALAGHIRDLVLIVESDLGFTLARFVRFVGAVSEDIIAALTADYLAGTDTENAKKDFVIGSHIAWLRRFYETDFPFDPESVRLIDLADRLALELRQTGWNDFVHRFAQLLKDLATVGRGLAGQFSGGVSVGAGRSSRRVDRAAVESPQISWYATWLADQAEELSRAEQPETWEDILNFFTLVEDYVVVKDRFKPQDEPFGAQVASQGVSFDVLEVWAWAADFLMDLLEAVFVIASFDKGSKLVNAISISLKSGKGIYTIVTGFTKGEAWYRGRQAFDIVDKLWEWTTPLWESLEGKGSGFKWVKAVKYVTNFKWATPDFEGKDLLKSWIKDGAKDLVLSTITLNNARNASEGSLHPKATKGILALTAFVGQFLGSIMVSISFPPFGGKRHFGFPKNEAVPIVRFFAANILFCGVGFGMLFALPGYWIANAISGKNAMNDVEFGDLLKGVVKPYLPTSLFSPFYLFWWDGRTNGGKLNGESDEEYKGYPDAATSPYELPFAKKADKWVECLQGHHAFWSHHTWSKHTYAADFGMDYGEEVLAMRSGTVTDYQDHLPDSSYTGWNFITIRHDDASEGAVPDPVHDLGLGGTPVVTYAIYANGRHFGVRHAFAARTPAVQPENIIGTSVKKGEVIMYAGDTGSEAIGTQVHVHVSGAAAQDAPSIPFVFKNLPSKGLIIPAKKGVPKTAAYYTSNNERKGDAPANARFQPVRQEGRILRSGADDDGQKYVVLDRFANNMEDDYKNGHIYLSFEDNGQTWYSYKKTKKYDAGNRKVWIVGDWDTPMPPPPGSAYVVGGAPRQNDDDFGHQFAYQSKPDNTDWTPYKLA